MLNEELKKQTIDQCFAVVSNLEKQLMGVFDTLRKLRDEEDKEQIAPPSPPKSNRVVSDVKYRHVREGNNNNKIALTVAYVTLENGSIRCGISVCNGDNFDKQFGRTIASSRLKCPEEWFTIPPLHVMELSNPIMRYLQVLLFDNRQLVFLEDLIKYYREYRLMRLRTDEKN